MMILDLKYRIIILFKKGVEKMSLQIIPVLIFFSIILMFKVKKEMATHSSILAYRILWTEEPGGLLSMQSHRDRHD